MSAPYSQTDLPEERSTIIMLFEYILVAANVIVDESETGLNALGSSGEKSQSLKDGVGSVSFGVSRGVSMGFGLSVGSVAPASIDGAGVLSGASVISPSP